MDTRLTGRAGNLFFHQLPYCSIILSDDYHKHHPDYACLPAGRELVISAHLTSLIIISETGHLLSIEPSDTIARQRGSLRGKSVPAGRLTLFVFVK